MPVDITPHDMDAVIDLNVHEESAVFETLSELQQRFPAEQVETLRRRVQQRLEEGARAGRIAFYYRGRREETVIDLSPEQGIKRLSDSRAWSPDWDEYLVAYEQGG